MQLAEQDFQVSSHAAASRPLSARFYRPELDILRFVAFLMVYFGHTIPAIPKLAHLAKVFVNISGFGVPIFFALSAYLITELLTIEKRTTGEVRLGSFYARRCLRIWPLYFLVLFVGFFLSGFFSGQAISPSGLISYVFLTGNWYTAVHDYLPLGLGALWSISVEEQFYLVWPLLVRSLTRRSLGIVCLLGWLFSQATLMVLCSRHALIEPTVWANSFVHLQYFALGAGVSLWLQGRIPQIRGSLRALMIGGAFLWLTVVDLVFNENRMDDLTSLAHTFPEFLLAGLTIVLLLVGLLGWEPFKDFRRLTYLGKISYGLYVYHLPCLLVLRTVATSLRGHSSPLWEAVVGLPMTVGVAAISYRLFESPFLRLKERFAVVQSRPVQEKAQNARSSLLQIWLGTLVPDTGQQDQ
jgi:peptidoglycan/LPS O-acetylase OafA/YrhL